MAGTKRRRGAASKPSVASSCASTNASSSSIAASKKQATKKSNSISKVLERLLEISSHKVRASNVLQAFIDPKVTDNWDSYYVLLATQIVHRLVVEQKTDTRILAALCDLLSRVMTIDKAKLEKTMSVAMGRTAAAKAVLAATMGAMQCLTRSMQEEPSPQHMVVVMAAVAALDRMVYLQAIPQDVRVMDWTLQDLDAVCAMIPCKPEEEEFLDRLEQLQETSSPAKSTARSTRRKTASSPKVTSPDIVVLTQALEVLQGDTSSQRIDARVVVKRWASTAIVWYRQGQRQLLQCVHHLAQQKNESCFELSRLLGRLLAIVAESGTNCGLRPPGGAMDQYIVSLGACHSPNENNENKRVDIRDWVVVTIQDVLQVHRQCLVESNSPICNDTEPSVASNRDTDVDVDVFTAPNLSVILHSLCRAAVSTVSDSGVSKQSEFTQVLMGIVTALCFLLLSDVDVPLDCQLSHFAISNLNETLRLLDEQPPPSSVATDVEVQERHSKLENTFHLQTPLPLPVIPQDDTIHGEDQSSTFAGLLTMRHEFTNEDVLSLTLRAVLQYDRKGRRLRIQEFLESQDDEEGGVTSQSKLLSVLTNLICRAMDTRIQPKLRTDMEEEVHLDTKPKAKGGRKRVAKTSGGRKTKQLKREKEQSASQQDEKDGASEYTRISTSRALLAKKIFTTLRHCLTIQKIPSSVLARSIRDVLDMDHLNDLISLGNLLDQVLIKTRTGVSRFSTTTNASESDAQATDPLSSPNICVHSNEFTSIERNLWSSHMIMCQVLGRGQTRYDGSLQSVLTEQQRKYTVQVIAGGKNSPWPLSLPAAHHAFLHANFTSNSVESHDSMAEQHLLTCFIKSIRKALQNLDEIQSFSKDSHCLYLDDGVLLSYNDARTILLAFSRLSAEDQRKSIEGLTNLLLSTLKGIQSDFSKQNNVAKNEEACIFIARVVVLTSAMVSMLVFGQPLRQALFADAGPTIISPPSFYSANEWYHCERTYMGLLDDWECPAVPELSSSSSPPRWTLLTERSLQNMRSLLELAFAIGFEAARKDQCYLLFAAWNGLGKLYSEGGNERLKVSDSTSLQINADNYPKRILQLRDDVCMIHNEVNNISEGQRTSTSTKLRSNLKSTLHRANILMGRLLESATTDEDVPISLFCLLAALPTYISSSISAHTKSDSDYFSTELAKRSPKQGRRQRAYSSESDRINSDAESVDSDGGDNDSDVRVDVVSRLRECCDAFGAAPIHPDWLDVSCSFQEGIRNSDAIDNAETALRMLNKLTATAFKEYKKNFLSALQAYKPNSSENDEFVALALDLLPWNTHEPSFASPLGPGTYSDDRDWKEDVSALCDLPEGLLDLVIDETLVKNIETAKESWCPNASLRLSGRLQDQKRPLSGWETSAPELRAGGEWELLLAEALTAACIAVKQYPEEATVTELESDDDPGAHSVSSIQRDLNDGRLQKGHIALKRAQIWRLIIATATSHMLPAAALLRMGINKAGRKPHPFSFHENNQDPYDVAPLYFSERLGHITHGSQLIRATTYQTVALLSNLSAHGDDSLSSICHAIASHLLVDTKSFCDMEGLQSIRLAFNGLKNLYQLAGSLKDKESSLAVFPFIVERLTFILADFSHIPVDVDSDKDQQSIARLLSFFGASGARTVDTIVGDSIDMFEILKGKEAEETMNVVSSSTWLKDETSLKGLDNLIAVLSGLPIKSNERSRACAAEILSNLVTGERRYLKDKACTSSILPVITTCFNNLAEDDVKNVILDNLIFWDITPSPSHQTSLSHLLQHMVGDGDRFHHAKFVLGVLVESFDRWPRSHGKDTLKPAFDCLLAFGCKFNALNEIGAKILSLKSPPLVNPSTDDDVVDLDVVTNFFSFVKDFRDAFQKKDGIVKINVDKVQNEVDIQESRKAQSAMTLATRCSFVEKTGYHGQHWYNCYTCGLVWEKGCCTLCALVCHKGHDVSYSRYSSFFCDCAAEDGASSSQNRVSCRCMIQLPADEVKKLLEAESADVNVEQQQAVVESTEIRSKEVDFSSRRIDIAFTSFGASAKVAVANLEKCLEAEAWFVALFNLLRHQLMVWKETKDPASDILPRLDNVMPCRAPPPRRVPPLILRKRLRKRHALPLDLHHLSAKTMIPIRCVKGFQTRLSTDTSTNAHLLAKLSRNDITRCNILADSRGRLVIAEPCSLTFCITSPAVATRYASKSSETPLPRQQMCILGSSSISFNIVGIRLCSKNERHMIVWGVAEACVVIIKPHWDGAERKIDLVLDFEQTDGDSDYLVKCDFVPGSQTSVVVGCGHYVRVFDITRSKDNRANAVVAYNLGFEVSLRDIALVPCVPFNNTENEIDTTCRSTHSMISKMFMLLENGRLHAVDLTTDAEGRMESPSDEPCELSGSVSLPTEGVRPRTGSPIGVAGSTAKSLGEGSRIVYLQQSRTLLYKCVSSCVVALMLDGCGSVEGSFELIPHVLSSDILWNGMDGHSIVGPFNHWTELGVVYSDGRMYFRVACIGRSSRTNQPQVVCVEFNEKDVKVKEILWNSGTSSGLSTSLSFEGLCAFSLPFVGNAVKECHAFGERAFLCTTTSAGSLLFFGEEVVDTVKSSCENGDAKMSFVNLSGVSSLHVDKPSFPLTIYEGLKNVSECEELVFVGEGTGCDSTELKSKLLRDRSSSLVCHRREGCTLSMLLVASPQQKNTQPKTSEDAGDLADKTFDRSHAIVALRLLVGSNISQVPSKVFIQGRPVDLTPRVKKWYSLPLTNEEIALGVRHGIVSIGIGPPFDSSSSSSVDSIEVYVTERERLAKWIPMSYIASDGEQSVESYLDAVDSQSGGDNDITCRRLIQSARALATLCEISPNSPQHIAECQRQVLRTLVEDTVFTRNDDLSETVKGLLKKLEPNERLRNSLYDECVLRGCMKILANAKVFFNESDMSHANEDTRWDATHSILRDCLDAVSKIARERPMNYLKCVENASENDASVESIASHASKMIIEGIRRSLPCRGLIDRPGGLIELCLTEIAIELNTERGKSLAKFDVVKQFLQSSNRDVADLSCQAVSDFCRRQGTTNSGGGLFRLLQGTRIVAYKCDSCGLCPLKDVRYTFLEEAFDIDLCKECYTVAESFAEKNQFDAAVDVSIDGRTVGADSKLACSQLRQMHPVPLEKMDVEQVDVRSNDRQSVVESAIEEEDDLNKALRMSLGANPSECGLSEAEEQLEPQAYEDFISYLFLNILDALSDCLDNKEHLSSQLAPLLRLLLDLIRNSSEGKSKNDRARRFARELSKGISSILSRRSIDGSLPHKSIMALVSCLRAAQLLAFHSDTEAASFFEQFHSDDETRLKSSVEVLCKVHGIPAVRRRSAKGKNKDRRFYVCGKERGQRCNFFKWADDVEAKSHGKYLVSSQMRDIIRTSLWNRPLSDGFTLNAALCELLEQDLFNDTDDEADVLFSMTGPFQEKKLPGDSLTSHYGKVERQSDFDDGVFCSREKLQDTSFDAGSRRVTVQKQLYCLDVRNSGDSTNHLLEGCLGLLPLVADYKTEGATRWFSLLCEIDISSNKTSELRNLARKVLKSLVGKKRTLYHSIRDHFSFGFQLQSLYKNSCPMLEAALLSGQRARVCNPKWATSIKLDWSTLSYGGLIGADELIFGTESPPARLRLIAKVLDGLWSVVKNGGDSWRRFCGQAALPSFHRSSRKPLPDLLAPEEHLRGSPQIVSLFWLGCCLSGSYQVKVLRLIEMALTKVDDARATVSLTQESDGLNLASSLESEEDVVSAISGLHLASPESILLLDDKKLRIEDLAAFVFYFILGGKSAELRRVCLNIATKLASHLCTIDRNRLFEKLFSSRFYEIGVVGKGSIEFMHLLQYLAQNLDSSIPLRDFGQIVLKSFKGQMNAVKYGRSNGDWVLIDSGSKRKFDLSECSYCLQTNTLSSTKLCRQTERRDLTARTSRGAYLEQSKSKQTSAAKVITSSAKKLHPEQVSPYSRFRLDALKIGTASNEFSTFFALKHRVVLSEVYLSVDDPRGRFVKTVDVYYSSGPVADAAELKSDDYASQWQKCVTMAVPRGASRASATIAHPVIAANLKIEYTDFFERPGGSKASDGSLIVHCPRCTRAVTNAHGVCGNCGEVASQCRKCRHINYDRLDAFLCVECGYCASGTFSLEVTAAVASNSIAITSDKDCDRSIRILGAVNTICDEVKAALTRTFQSIDQQMKSSRVPPSPFNSDINRSLVGLPPILEGGKPRHVSFIDRVDKQGSVVRLAARPESNHTAGRSSVAADRTRSLLRLARQIRSESSSTWDRRRSGDMIIHHLGRGIAVDNIDDERDLIGLLEEGNVFEGSEPLNRTIANVRASQSGPSNGHNASFTKVGSTQVNKKEPAKEMLDECHRLHMLTREAQRERHELKRRIGAWQRLNKGILIDLGTPIDEIDMDMIRPSQCSICGSTVALQLLNLWSHIFAAHPTEVEVTQEFLSLLLTESSCVGKTLSDTMRNVVKDVATKSESGTKLVLKEIRNRLLSTNDPVSAEILGKIMAVEDHFMPEEYSKLAMELLARQPS